MDKPDGPAWKKFYPLIPRRTVDGGWTNVFGQSWRRFKCGKWEYKQDKETEEDWLDRQW